MRKERAQWFKEPKYAKLYERFCSLVEDLRYPNSEGTADEIRVIQSFEEWLKKNEY
jgi:hypothetical protein